MDFRKESFRDLWLLPLNSPHSTRSESFQKLPGSLICIPWILDDPEPCTWFPSEDVQKLQQPMMAEEGVGTVLASRYFLLVRGKASRYCRRWLSISPFERTLFKNFVCQDEKDTQKDLTWALPPEGKAQVVQIEEATRCLETSQGWTSEEINKELTKVPQETESQCLFTWHKKGPMW